MSGEGGGGDTAVNDCTEVMDSETAKPSISVELEREWCGSR